MPTSIAAVIITLNEEKNISRCLSSLAEWADEIIVVDSGSTDRTADLCRQFPVKFISTQWLGYGPTKNYGASLSNCDYIFSIDADEEVSPELAHSIKKHKETTLNGVYTVKRLNNFCGKWIRHGNWERDFKIRLFPKKVKWNESQVHESLNWNSMPNTFLEGDLYHYSYANVTEFREKTIKYANLAAAQQKNKSVLTLVFKAFFSPLSFFIKNYFFRLGFLDGKEGLIIQLNGSYHAFLKYALAIQKKYFYK